MQLEELRLIAYGPFKDCTLKLQPGLNVLYGPNEAGKSSALRAVHALLFGVEERTKDDFVHSYTQLRIGGVLVDSQGTRLACVRRKGRRSTLRDGGDNQPIDDGVLRALLGGVNEEFFTSVFCIDHERLRAGGEEVVRGEGRVGELLFAVGGVAQLREKQQALEDAASALFKSGGRNPGINSALTELRELNGAMRKLQQSPEEWARHDAEHRRLVEQEKKVRKELGETESTKLRLDRFHKAQGFVGTWKEKRSELVALADVVALPDDAEQRFREANEKRTLAEADKKKAEKRVEELQLQLEELDVPEALLSEERRIDELYRRLGGHEKAASDRGGLAAQQRTARGAAKRTIEKLGWGLSVENAGDRRVADDKKVRVRTLASRHGEVTQGKTRQQQILDGARRKHTELMEYLAGEKKPKHPVSLQEIVSAASAALEVEDGLAAQRAEVERLEREANIALACLPLWEGALEEACRLEVPGDETVDRFDASWRDLIAERKKLTEQQEANQTEREQVVEGLAALELAESVPIEEELTSRRETRDRGVRLAVQRLGGEEIDDDAVDAFVREVADGGDLASALEPSVRQADDVADRLRREASRVAEKSQLVARLRSLDGKGEQLEAKLATVKEHQVDWENGWKKCWEASGIDPAFPSEMRGWLRKHAELASLSGDSTSASEHLARDEKRVMELRKKLAEELSQEDIETSQEASLQQLVKTAQNRLEEVEEVRRSRENLETDVSRASDEVEQAEKYLAAAEGELSAWRKDWDEALRPLELEKDALPEQAEAVLGNLDQLFHNLDEAERFGSRIWGIDQTAKEFAEAANEVAMTIAPDLADRPVEEVASTLNQRLSNAKQVRQRAESLQERLESEKDAITEAERDVSNRTAALNTLVAEAACGSIANLPTAIEKSRRMKSLEADLTQLESQLAPLCAGQPLSEFVADAEREDADRLPTQIEELDGQVQSLRGRLEETIVAREREAGILGNYDDSAGAAEKAEERQSVLARMEDDVREYVVAITASRLLRRAVERYQERAQGPVLSGASDHFRKLTRGSFDGLRTDYDESGHEVLVGVRPDGKTLPVEGMSDGARDQLYLALRLGTLDYWFVEHEPIPFIVDDVLLTFDDARATAALETLATLSERNQMLFFTHNQHMVDLAKEVCRSDGTKHVHVVTEWGCQ